MDIKICDRCKKEIPKVDFIQSTGTLMQLYNIEPGPYIAKLYRYNKTKNEIRGAVDLCVDCLTVMQTFVNKFMSNENATLKLAKDNDYDTAYPNDKEGAPSKEKKPNAATKKAKSD